jgi:hypothetical protein
MNIKAIKQLEIRQIVGYILLVAVLIFQGGVARDYGIGAGGIIGFSALWIPIYYLVRKKKPNRTSKTVLQDIIIFCTFCLFAVLIIAGS